MNNHLPVPVNGTVPVSYSKEEIQIIKASHFKGLEDEQISYALKKAEKMGLDFFSGQVVAWPGRGGKVEVYTTIQGLRSKAEATGVYFPGPEATFAYNDKGQVISATSYVKRWDERTGQWVELSETSMMVEYAHITTGAWQTSKHIMLAKTAEARVLRRVFPQLADLHIQEEHGTVDDAPAQKAADRSEARAAKLNRIQPGVPPAAPAAEAPAPAPTVITVDTRQSVQPVLTPTGERAELAAIVNALTRPKITVLFKRLGMDVPARLEDLTDEDVSNVLPEAVKMRG